MTSYVRSILLIASICWYYEAAWGAHASSASSATNAALVAAQQQVSDGQLLVRVFSCEAQYIYETYSRMQRETDQAGKLRVYARKLNDKLRDDQPNGELVAEPVMVPRYKRFNLWDKLNGLWVSEQHSLETITVLDEKSRQVTKFEVGKDGHRPKDQYTVCMSDTGPVIK